MFAAAALGAALASAVTAAALPTTTEGAECRPGESGPALQLSVTGMKDRKGMLELNLYPPNDKDFLADDDELLAAGKDFRRVRVAPQPDGAVEVCIRAPRPGRYSFVLLHDRNADGKFHLFQDGVAFTNNPHLKFSRPKAETVAVNVGPEVTHAVVAMKYPPL